MVFYFPIRKWAWRNNRINLFMLPIGQRILIKHKFFYTRQMFLCFANTFFSLWSSWFQYSKLKQQYIFVKYIWFSRGSSVLLELQFEDVGFCGVRKTGQPEEKPSDQGEDQRQTQLTYDTRPESNPGHIRGRRALSPLRSHCYPNSHHPTANVLPLHGTI